MSDEKNYRPNWLSKFYVNVGNAIRWIAKDTTSITTFAKIVAAVQRNYLWVLVVAGVLGYCATWWFITYRLPPVIIGILDSLAAATADETRSYAYALGALLTALVVLTTLPVALIKTWINERSTRNAEQGHITDRLNKAIEMLGAEKSVKRPDFKPKFQVHEDGKWKRDGEGNPKPAVRPDGSPLGDWEHFETTVPNLEVRLGAIYALERIARDSDRDHITVMEVLCAYIRENAKARDAEPLGLEDWPDWREDADEGARDAYDPEVIVYRDNLRTRIASLDAPRVDIQAALTVIGRREPDQIDIERRADFRLDLRGTNLRKADLRKAKLDKALLTGAQMQGADLREAQMQGAVLREAQMEGAVLIEAQMQGANLIEAQMQGAVFWNAQMQGALLSLTKMQWAILGGAQMQLATVTGAQMQRTYLGGAQMQEAALWQVDLRSADFSRSTIVRARLKGADLSQAENLSQDSVNTAFGDCETAGMLPDGVDPPDHWHTYDDEQTFDEKYDAWIAAGAPPGKPKTGT